MSAVAEYISFIGKAPVLIEIETKADKEVFVHWQPVILEEPSSDVSVKKTCLIYGHVFFNNTSQIANSD